MTRDEIGVQVRQEDVCDAKAVRFREGQILIDVALRIYHGGDACLLVADEIRGVGEAVQIKLMEDHALASAHYEKVYETLLGGVSYTLLRRVSPECAAADLTICARL